MSPHCICGVVAPTHVCVKCNRKHCFFCSGSVSTKSVDSECKLCFDYKCKSCGKNLDRGKVHIDGRCKVEHTPNADVREHLLQLNKSRPSLQQINYLTDQKLYPKSCFDVEYTEASSLTCTKCGEGDLEGYIVKRFNIQEEPTCLMCFESYCMFCGQLEANAFVLNWCTCGYLMCTNCCVDRAYQGPEISCGKCYDWKCRECDEQLVIHQHTSEAGPLEYGDVAYCVRCAVRAQSNQ